MTTANGGQLNLTIHSGLELLDLTGVVVLISAETTSTEDVTLSLTTPSGIEIPPLSVSRETPALTSILKGPTDDSLLVSAPGSVALEIRIDSVESCG
jgi:hypothetical protein